MTIIVTPNLILRLYLATINKNPTIIISIKQSYKESTNVKKLDFQSLKLDTTQRNITINGDK
jgi:hypothetical protein